MPIEGNSATPGELLHEKLVTKGDADLARKPNLVSSVYRFARLANDISTLASGNPNRVAIRLKNKLVGRTLGKFLLK